MKPPVDKDDSNKWNAFRKHLYVEIESRQMSQVLNKNVLAVQTTFQGTCHFCKKKGHRKSECKAKDKYTSL